MHIVKTSLLFVSLCCLPAVGMAKTASFDLKVQFQNNLYGTDTGAEHLLERIYFSADSLETLRESMYAGKYFDKKNGTFKLIFYPAMGQTEPAR